MYNDAWFREIAEVIAKNSKCLSRKIAAVVVRDGKYIMATGYNGPPSGYPHCKEVCPRKAAGYESGEGLENCPAGHAERNAICEAARFGIPLEGCSLFLSALVPCRECAKEIVNAGIKEVIVVEIIPYSEKGLTGLEILLKSGISVRKYS